jgi:acyl-CoA synthetase (AMP-forming)/AMP-acid ligase II
MSKDDKAVPTTMTDLLMQWVTQDPHRMAYRYVDRRGRVLESSREQVFRTAMHIAGRLTSMGVAGQRVMLTCTDAAHFVPGFHGCLLAGAVAVPAPAGANRRLTERIALLAKDAQPVVMVCDTDAMVAVAAKIGVPALDLRTEAMPDAGEPLSPDIRMATQDPEALAFIQYSSGSTGDPKGVMVTHRNILANCRSLIEAMALNLTSRLLAPLPLFHDMGLVGGILVPLCFGGDSTLIDPLYAVSNPLNWLKAISQYRITHDGGPNFMYEIALGAEDELDEAIDLSSWKVAYCGAGAVRASTAQRFCRRFAASGFAATSFYPCYGLAESTLFVTGVKVASEPVFDEELPLAARASCGRPYGGTELIIVDPDTLACEPDGCEGKFGFVARRWPLATGNAKLSASRSSTPGPPKVTGHSCALGIWGS